LSHASWTCVVGGVRPCLGFRKSSKLTGVDRNIMGKFLDSNRILNGYLFYSSPITNFEITLQQVRKTWAIYGDLTSPIQVWCYSFFCFLKFKKKR